MVNLQISFLKISIKLISENDLMSLIKKSIKNKKKISLYPLYFRSIFSFLFFKNYRSYLSSLDIIYSASSFLSFLILIFFKKKFSPINPTQLMFNTIETLISKKASFFFVGISSSRYKNLQHYLKIFFPEIFLKGSIDYRLLKNRLLDSIDLIKKMQPTVLFVSRHFPSKCAEYVQKELILDKKKEPTVISFCSKGLEKYSKTKTKIKKKSFKNFFFKKKSLLSF